ncbi:hypothetical protein EMIHUDRAFT_207448 [Emiliania huxleyi CCMP1516]|uniref:Mitochondrial carrier protein n=2 Tax=Emiliania huxleyi TaxID=2903 RepID=A0A0D3JFH9_EMIH1|nr:hypothetical protein EMIHUDRAFT_207448 [Emiliania huxleyi CCMP1516]EOD22264.1 hypothetical protein EMIHUDRAFT_207448 [Emiliania huxleyi CCMP1516]|eukprot:XP_005774693.1 hypothetical protein EMIHUDRAFT_207448 [Emiliania huxleyi CCMP1516]
MASSSAGDASASAEGLKGWQVTMISGSISGAVATLARQPIQRLKWIRQVDPGQPVPYGTVLRRTVQEGGVLGLFRGSTAGIVRNIPHSSLVYTIYPWWERNIKAALGGEARGGESSFGTRFFAGFATGFCATVATHPLDTIRVRISEAKLADILSDVGRQGGVRALYHGFAATMAVFGYLAGLSGELLIYPLDTALGDGSPLARKSAIMMVFRQEGLKGMCDATPLDGVSLTVNDCVKDMLRPYRRRAEGR